MLNICSVFVLSLAHFIKFECLCRHLCIFVLYHGADRYRLRFFSGNVFDLTELFLDCNVCCFA
jgi:hypothetical protein